MQRRILANLFLFSTLASPHFCGAQSQSSIHKDPDVASLATTAWNGLRDHGVSLQGLFIYDWSVELHPDESTGFGRYSFDLGVPIDGSKLWHLDGSTGMVRLRHHMNNFGEDGLGESQLYSNIDGSSRTNLYEAWLEQKLVGDKPTFEGWKDRCQH